MLSVRHFGIIATILGSGLCAFAHGPGATNDFGGRRVLLVAVDGCRPDALRKVIETGGAPSFRSLVARGTVAWAAYTGGELGSDSEQQTYSGPGFATLLTGVWRDKHGVSDNRFRFNRIAQWPHFLRRLRDAMPKVWTASLCDWPPIHKFIVGASQANGREFLDFEFTATPDPALKDRDYAARDAELAARAVEHVTVADPDVIFVYFGQVDEVGHGVADTAGRFSPDNEQYLAAIGAVDAHVGRLLAAIHARPHFQQEDWLVLAITDHGGRGMDHGGQSPEERGIWILASGGLAPRGLVVNEAVPQTVIPATVFAHLGVPVKSEWGWPEHPFAVGSAPK